MRTLDAAEAATLRCQARLAAGGGSHRFRLRSGWYRRFRRRSGRRAALPRHLCQQIPCLGRELKEHVPIRLRDRHPPLVEQLVRREWKSVELSLFQADFRQSRTNSDESPDYERNGDGCQQRQTGDREQMCGHECEKYRSPAERGM